MRAQLRAPHVYTFVTGKQTAFALLGHGLLRSTGGRVAPTQHLHLVLGALTPPDIKLTYQNTQLYETAASLSTYFTTSSPELLNHLCSKVCEMTAGLPRMVHACFEALCQLQADCLVMSSETDINNALEHAYQHLASRGTNSSQRSLMCSPEAMVGPLSGAYCALLLVSLLELPLDSCDGFIALGTGERLPLLAVVNMLDLFLDTRGCTGNQVRIRCAKWALRHLLLDQPDALDARFRLIVPLWNAPPSVLGKGEPLELITRTRLAYVLSLGVATGGRRWAELFPVFRNTLLALCIVNIDVLRPVRCIPRVVTVSPADLQFDAMSPWSRSMGVNDWAALFKSGLLPPNSIGFPAPESHSPNVLVRCGDDVVAAIQCKLGTTAVTWATLRAEIEKTSHLLRACRKVCLVVVAFELGQQLLSAFHDGDATKLVVCAGKWVLRGTKLELSGRKGLCNDIGAMVLEVPEHMEVVVLGSSGLCSFLGDESVQALKELINARRTPVTNIVCPLQLSLSLLGRHGMHHILVTSLLQASSPQLAHEHAAAAPTPPPALVPTFPTWAAFFEAAGLDETQSAECELLFEEGTVQLEQLPDITLEMLKVFGVKMGTAIRLMKLITRLFPPA